MDKHAIEFEPGDAVSFCGELMVVESNHGSSGVVRYLSGDLASTRHAWAFEGEMTRYATAAELEPLVARFPLARIGLARVHHRSLRSVTTAAPAVNVVDTLKGSRTGVEPDNSIEAGHRVRSYDFAGSESCYAEGLVDEITGPMEGCRRYKIRVETRVFDGVAQKSHEEFIFPPVNGTPSTFGGVTNAVARIN